MKDQLKPSISEIARGFATDGQNPDVETYDIALDVFYFTGATEVQAQQAADSSAVTGK